MKDTTTFFSPNFPPPDSGIWLIDLMNIFTSLAINISPVLLQTSMIPHNIIRISRQPLGRTVLWKKRTKMLKHSAKCMRLNAVITKIYFVNSNEKLKIFNFRLASATKLIAPQLKLLLPTTAKLHRLCLVTILIIRLIQPMTTIKCLST